MINLSARTEVQAPYFAMPFFDPRHPIDSHQRHLPHWQQGEVPLFITWSLIDSLPEGATAKLKAKRDHWLRFHPKPWDEKTEKEYYVLFANPINELLDRGHGECILRDPTLARIAADTLLKSHQKSYRLHSFVVMPNHVHALVTLEPEQKLARILQSWKGGSAREINETRDASGAVWQQEYWDRLIRSKVHFEYTLRYVRDNPTKAKLSTNEFIFWENTELGL